jgi:hypothetical protein
MLKTTRTVFTNFLAISLSLLALTACVTTSSADQEAHRELETTVEANDYRNNLVLTIAQFEMEFIDFYLNIGNITEDLLTDFLENSDDANKGYLAALKRIRIIDDSTDDFFRLGTELKHLTLDEMDPTLTENDETLIAELNPLVIDPMDQVSEFLQVARDAATALSIVDKPKWISLQDKLVNIAQEYYETGTARGMLYRSMSESLEDEILRAAFYDLGETFRG